jgi:NADH dehydrogenase
VLPVSGEGRAAFQPIWARDVAECVVGALDASAPAPRYELAGPETLTYDEMSDLVSRIAGRPRDLVHLPLPAVKASLVGLRAIFGEAVFATWQEAELMEVAMVSERGTADAQALGVEPRRMSDVLQTA